MNWEVVAAIAELLGAIGVIGSLIYVASQVKAGARASRIESKLRVTEMMVDFGDKLLENPELNQIMLKGRKDSDSLSKEEYVTFSNLCRKASWFLSAGYFMHKKKAIDDNDWYEFKVIALYWTHSLGYQQWWKKDGHHGYIGDFKNFLEVEIEKSQQ
jgi:hypothetical protein